MEGDTAIFSHPRGPLSVTQTMPAGSLCIRPRAGQSALDSHARRPEPHRAYVQREDSAKNLQQLERLSPVVQSTTSGTLPASWHQVIRTLTVTSPGYLENIRQGRHDTFVTVTVIVGIEILAASKHLDLAKILQIRFE